MRERSWWAALVVSAAVSAADTGHTTLLYGYDGRTQQVRWIDGVELNREQQQAVEHGGGPLVVLAGAGTGKTRVLVQRIVRIVESGTSPRQVLAVTFTNKAASEMRERLRALLGSAADAMWIGTFHSTCARLLRYYGADVGLSQRFSIFDTDDQLRLIKSILKELDLVDVATPRVVASAIDRAKNQGEDPVAFSRDSANADVIRAVAPRYQAHLEREDAVDFNDLLLKVLELARNEVLRDELCGLFEHVLVDEFQDTNRVQFRLVQLFARGTGNLTVVGDDDQSIYSWRGAVPENLLDFEHSYPQAVIVRLEQNYRSTQVVLDAANAVIDGNVRRHHKRLWTQREGGAPLIWRECQDEREEGRAVAAAVTSLVEDHGYEQGEIAVLYRTHAQSRVLEEWFRRQQISYRIVGGTSFFQRKEVKDVIAYLRLCVNPAADSCFQRVVNVPSRGIGKTTVARVAQVARDQRVAIFVAARACVEEVHTPLGASARKRMRDFIELIDGLAKAHEDGASIAELVVQIGERSGMIDRYQQDDDPQNAERLANLAELVTMASDFDDDVVEIPDLSVAGTTPEAEEPLIRFLQYYALWSGLDERDGRGETVSLMTVHGAKGLEFPVVFVTGLEDGLFPSLRGREGAPIEDDLAEERRLAYVALTRAQDQVVLTSARTRRQWGEVRMNRPSRFLDDIPRECLQIQGHVPVVRARTGPAPVRAGRLRAEGRGAPTYDDFDQSDPYDELADPTGPGAIVHHGSFGSGRVIECRGEGRDSKLVIDFPGVGRKTILRRFLDPGP